MKIKIKYGGKTGEIDYQNTEPVIYNINFPSLPLDIRRKIVEYLKTEREFVIPESQRIDDYRTDKAKPVDSIGYFEQSFNNLWKTGVRLA